MSHIGDWDESDLYIALKVGEYYYSVLSRYHTVEEVLDAVLAHVDRNGFAAVPFVFLAVTSIDTASMAALIAHDLIDIVVE